MSKHEVQLHAMAEREWPGSGDACVQIYACVNASGRGEWLGALAYIRMMLFSPSMRQQALDGLARKVEAAKPRRLISSPKGQRYEAAIKGVEALREKAAAC